MSLSDNPDRVEAPLTLRLEHYDELDSTQDEMHRRLAAGTGVHGLVLRTEHQTRGRGQRQYDWHGSEGGSYQTLAVKDTMPPSLNQSHAPVHMAIGIAHELRRHGVRVRIKWPNDLYYQGKKLAGILTEYHQQHLLIGVGMNVNNEVPDTATGLRGWNVDVVHALVLAGLEHGLRTLRTQQDIVHAFRTYDLLAGHELPFMHGNTIITGIARGIDAAGRFLLELPDGTQRRFSSGRVMNVPEILRKMQSRTRFD